jgi:hypothetical protein
MSLSISLTIISQDVPRRFLGLSRAVQAIEMNKDFQAQALTMISIQARVTKMRGILRVESLFQIFKLQSNLLPI